MDSVELVMAFEEDFGINISDPEAEKMETVGEAFDLIHRKLQERDSGEAEEKAIRAVAGLAKDHGPVDRNTRLVELFPYKIRPAAWKQLREKIGFVLIPDLRRPRWLKVAGWLVMIAAGAACWPQLGIGVAAALLAGFIFLLLTDPFGRSPPPDFQTVGDLISNFEKQQAIFRENRGLSREAVREKTVEIIVDQLGVKPGQCADEARFVEDLGID